jgi:hypothetical protein
LVIYEGQCWHLAEMRLAGERLVIFGVSCGVAYVEVFDKKTGEALCRFSTEYLVKI